MNIRIGSAIAFAAVITGVIYLLYKGYVFSNNPVSILIQACAVVLMVWARLTLGTRSFHATANTTKGQLITKGPYRWLRHPIYAAIIYFFIGSVIAYPYKETIGAFILIFIGSFTRIILEERSLIETYGEEYSIYSRRTKRIIPFLI